MAAKKYFWIKATQPDLERTSTDSSTFLKREVEYGSPSELIATPSYELLFIIPPLKASRFKSSAPPVVL